MKPLHMTLAAGAAVVIAAFAFGAFSPASAQKGGGEQARTPANWSYEIRNGRRVPRSNRVTQPDGSWREEVRDGACVTVRSMSAAGEYRESRECQ